MKHWMSVCMWGISAMVSAAYASDTMNIMRWETSNGVPVYFVARTEVPMVDVRVVVAAGSGYDGANPGVAALTNGLVNEGTDSHSADELANGLASVGAQFHADLDQDKAILSLRSLSDTHYLKSALGWFLEMLHEPAFPRAAVKQLKMQQMAALRAAHEDPMNVAIERLFLLLYGSGPYGHSVLGTAESVDALDGGDVADFYKQYYVAHNAKVIIVGHITRDDANQIAEQIALALPVGQAATPIPATAVKGGSRRAQVTMPVQQSSMVLGIVGISRKDPNYFPLIVGNAVLGGLPLTSLLFEHVRNQAGLAYYVGSQFVPLEGRGPFLIALQTRAKLAPLALESTQETVSDFVTAGPTRAQLAAAKDNLLGSLPIKLSTNEGIMDNLTNMAFYDLPLTYLSDYPNAVTAVTPEAVKAAFQQVVILPSLAIVSVGPGK